MLCKEKYRECRKRKTGSIISETAKAGTFHLHRKSLFAGLTFFFVCFALIASPLYASGNPVVRIIVVNTQADAEGIIAEMAKGRSFASLAKERSVDEESRDRFGEIKSTAFEGLDKPLKEAALKLRPGQVSGVLALSDKRHAIVLLVDMTHYRNGARAFKSGDLINAKTDLLRHVELNPDAVKARILLGRICEASNKTKEAEVNYRDALRFDPGNEEAYLRLGALYLRMGQFQTAKDLYEDGLHHLPDSKPLMAGLKKAKGRPSATVSALVKKEDEAVEPMGDETPKRVDVVNHAPEAAKPKEDMVTAVSPKDKPSNNVTSADKNEKTIHIRIIFTEKESDAQDVLSEVGKGKPFALVAKERSIDEKTRQVYGYLGEVSIESLHASIQEALSKMTEGQISGVIKMDQNRYAVVQVTEIGLYREAERAFIAGDHAAAETKLLKYVEANPDAVKARTMLGKIYEDKNEPSKAIRMYKEAISYSPKTVLVYERLARVYLFLGMYGKAKDVFIQGLKQVPSSPELEEGIEMADMLLIGEGERMP